MAHPPITTNWVIDRTAVRYHREIQGLTQREVAERMGRHRTLIAEIERGAFTPTSLRSISRLAQALGVNIEAIATPAAADASEPAA